MTRTSAPTRFDRRILRGSKKIALWAGAWALTTALLALGPEFLWAGQLWLTLVTAAASLAAGVGVAFAWLHHLRELDELHRKVHLEAMAMTLGVGWFVSIPYTLLEGHDAAPFDDDIARAALMILISLTFAVSILAGLRRYR
jgi:hypothetical protein